MLPGLSGGLLSVAKPKQRPVHKLEKKEKGQLLSTLHGLFFKELEVTDPDSSQSHHLQTDPALPSCWKATQESHLGYLLAVVPAPPVMKPSSAVSPPREIKLFVNRHREATSTGDHFPWSYSCVVKDVRMAMNLLTLRAKCKTPSFDLVLA